MAFDIFSGLGQAVTRGLRTYLDLEERQRQREEAERMRALQLALSLANAPDEYREALRNIYQSIFPNIRITTTFPTKPRPIDEAPAEEVLKDHPQLLEQIPATLRRQPWGHVRTVRPDIARQYYGEDPEERAKREREEVRMLIAWHKQHYPHVSLPEELIQRAKAAGLPIPTRQIVVGGPKEPPLEAPRPGQPQPPTGRVVEVEDLPTVPSIELDVPGIGKVNLAQLPPATQRALLDWVMDHRKRVPVNIDGHTAYVSADAVYKAIKEEGAKNIQLKIGNVTLNVTPEQYLRFYQSQQDQNLRRELAAIHRQTQLEVARIRAAALAAARRSVEEAMKLEQYKANLKLRNELISRLYRNAYNESIRKIDRRLVGVREKIREYREYLARGDRLVSDVDIQKELLKLQAEEAALLAERKALAEEMQQSQEMLRGLGHGGVPQEGPELGAAPQTRQAPPAPSAPRAQMWPAKLTNEDVQKIHRLVDVRGASPQEIEEVFRETKGPAVSRLARAYAENYIRSRRAKKKK